MGRCLVTAAGIEPATVIMNHGAAALLVYGNYSTTNKDLDGVILCRVYTLMVAVRLSLYQKGAALYCIVFLLVGRP